MAVMFAVSKSTSPANPQASIEVTAPAVDKIHALKTEQNDLLLMLRINITGGGCHGFQYGFAFEEESQASDIVINASNDQAKPTPSIDIIIDPISLQYLDGCTIDYQCDAQGERFVIRNPKAKTTCGCNNSFSV